MVDKENILPLGLVKPSQYIEGWATVKWHRMHGGIGFPTDNTREKSSSFRKGSSSNMPCLFDFYITVEETLRELKNPWILIAFLLWCYPKNGTYERQGSYKNFRPKELVKMALDFKWGEDEITDSIKNMEYQFLYALKKKL